MTIGQAGLVTTDWIEWHDSYDDPNSAHSSRLSLIQGHIADALTALPAGPIKLVSACAGDARDVLGVLAGHARAAEVAGRLIELDPALAERARTRVEALRLDRIEVVTGDASITSSYIGAVPADLVLFCGVFGNVADGDIAKTISVLPSFCSPNATVIWTRHRREPDLTPKVRQWFAQAGFTEIAFDSPESSPGVVHGWIGVGVHRFGGPPMSVRTNERLFTFFR